MGIQTQDDSYVREEELLTLIKGEEHSVTVFGIIKLNPGLSKTNFVCCMIFYMINVFSMAVPGSLQSLIILHPDYYNISDDNAGSITSLILIIQLVVKIFVSIPYGHAADKFGRKPMLYFGAFNYLVGSLMIPASNSIFPGFVIAKSLSANAATALTSVPLLADYIADESKGKAAAIAAMFFGIGGLGANLFAKALLYSKISLGMCYIITGVLVFGVIILNTFGLKSNYKHTSHSDSETEDKLSFIHHIKEAIEIFRGNAWLRILMVLKVLGSSDFMVFFTFMTIFVKSLFPKGVDQDTQNIVVNNLQTFIIVPMILGNVGYGYLMDKKGMLIRLAIFALAGGGVSFLLIAASTDPYEYSLKIGALLLGGTLPGLFVISNYIGIKNYPPAKRGIMHGFAELVGYISFFIIATGGGILYDHWRKDGPFLICAGLLVVAIILTLVMYRNIKN